MAKTKKSKKEKSKKKIKKNVIKKKNAIKHPAKKIAAKKIVAKKTATKKVIAKKAIPQIPAKPKGLPEEMLAAALKVLDEKQADQIVTVELAGRSSIADYMIIASGRAGRQVVALADHLREAFFKLGVRSVRIEGQQDVNWVLVDAGDVIIHLFLPEVRKYYDLDSLWNRKPHK